MNSNSVVLGVDISGTSIRVGKVVNEKLVDFLEEPISQNETNGNVIKNIISIVERLFTDDVVGIGFSVSGIVDSGTGTVVISSGIKSLNDTALRKILEEHFKRTVYVDNDTNCFSLGVKYFGSGKFYKNVIGLIVGAGLGAGVVIDSHLYVGGNNGAGELGQIAYEEHVLEYYASGQFFKNEYSIGYKEVVKKAEMGDKEALRIFEEFGRYFGDAISILMHIFDPQIIVIGGYMSSSFKFYKQAMWERIEKSPIIEFLKDIIVDVNDVPNITLLGAAALYFDAMKNKSFEAEKKRRMQVEDELLQERNTLHSILENIPDRIYLKDTEARFTKMNKAMVDSLGYESESQLIGKNEIEIFDTTSAKAIHRKDKTVIKNGKALLNDESKLVDGENKEIWFLSSKIPLKNVKEEIVGLVGISRDITKIKKAEERLKAYSEILQTAKKETDNILENVDEGLFLLNDVLLIGSQYSKALCRILNTKKLAGKSIVEFLGDKISHEDVDTVEHFLDMFFDSSYDESMIMELNPLQRIKMFFPDTGVTKTLTFNFKRIYDKKGHIQELIVIVKDITAQVKLEEKLKESEVQAKKQMEWVMSIMRVEPSMMRDFIDGMKKEFGTIEQYFKIVKKDKKFDSFTDKLYRSAHLIKGNAAILNLIFFADEMHLFEDQISIVQKKESIDLGDIKSLYGKFRVLKNSIKDIDELLSRMSQLHSQIRTTRSYENTMLVKSLQNYLKQISADLDKNVAMDVSKFDAKIIPYKYRLVVKDVVIQLIKNSVAHGIEDKDDREFYEKPEQGMITLKCAEKGDSFYLTVHDDGRGIDTDKIREKFKGKKDIDHMSDVDVAQLIYESGMSTNDKVTMISGRGVGLDAVKDKVGKYKGSISLSYKKEQFCQFDIVFPLK